MKRAVASSGKAFAVWPFFSTRIGWCGYGGGSRSGIAGTSSRLSVGLVGVDVICCALYGGGGTLRFGVRLETCRCELLSIRIGGNGGLVDKISKESSDGAVSLCPGKKLSPMNRYRLSYTLYQSEIRILYRYVGAFNLPSFNGIVT